MFGGTPSRNMVSLEKTAPTAWDVETGANIKWRVKVGSQTYAGPTVYDGLRGMQFVTKAVESHQGGAKWVSM